LWGLFWFEHIWLFRPLVNCPPPPFHHFKIIFLKKLLVSQCFLMAFFFVENLLFYIKKKLQCGFIGSGPSAINFITHSSAPRHATKKPYMASSGFKLNQVCFFLLHFLEQQNFALSKFVGNWFKQKILPFDIGTPPSDVVGEP
jgi:hypothetical protein